MAIIQPDGSVLELYSPIFLSTGEIVCFFASFTDPAGLGDGAENGRRASMIPNYAGIIRAGELTAGVIPHALALSVGAECLSTSAPLYPALTLDNNQSGYAGDFPMGAWLSIPAGVNLAALGLTTSIGLMIAIAIQTYGGYIVDQTGPHNFLILTQQNAADIPLYDGAIAADIGLIAAACQVTAITPGNKSVAAGVGALTIAGKAPTVSATQNRQVLAGVGAHATTGFAPSIVATQNRNVLAGKGAHVIAGNVPSVVASGGVTPAVSINFDSTALNTTAKVLASNARTSNGAFIPELIVNEDSRNLTIVSKPYGGRTNAMQYWWQPGAGKNPANESETDYSISPGGVYIGSNHSSISSHPLNGTGVSKVWFAFACTFDPGFSLISDFSTESPEYKFILSGDYFGGTGRINGMLIQTGRLVAGLSGNEEGIVDGTFQMSDLNDGVPHEFRFFIDLGTGSNGIIRATIDGALALNATGQPNLSDNTEISIIRLGANLNMGNATTNSNQFLWWHYLDVYKSNPGWGI
jgi:hypothetical protein